MAEVRLSRKLAVEFLGTAALVFCGPGTAAATFMVGRSTGVPFSMAQLGVIALAFMTVIVAMIYTIGHISGCHINPAVTVALVAARKARWSELPGYLAAQFAGAIAGGFAIWSILEQPGVDAGLGVLSYLPGHSLVAFVAGLLAATAYALLGRSAGSGQTRAVVGQVRTMKKLINDPDAILVEALTGMAAAHPSLTVDLQRRYVTAAGRPRPGKVSLLSGGGSGHEPLHGGDVGGGGVGAARAGAGVTSP